MARVLRDDTLPFVNEWVWSKVSSNGSVNPQRDQYLQNLMTKK